MTPKKEGNQWYDVGIIKGTSCLVSYYHLPADGKQGSGDVGDKKVCRNIYLKSLPKRFCAIASFDKVVTKYIFMAALLCQLCKKADSQWSVLRCLSVNLRLPDLTYRDHFSIISMWFCVRLDLTHRNYFFIVSLWLSVCVTMCLSWKCMSPPYWGGDIVLILMSVCPTICLTWICLCCWKRQSLEGFSSNMT